MSESWADLLLLQGAHYDPATVTTRLASELFPTLCDWLNRESMPVQYTLFDDERLPQNQANLSDVRTRIGPLLEYELGRAITANVPLAARGASLCYVLANKYPDLVVRDADGRTCARLEVKAVDVRAEEKAANFDTLIKDVQRGRDFVVVLVWEIRRHESKAFRHPTIHGIHVFDAYELARIRDNHWLHAPLRRKKDTPEPVGYKGYDLCHGVIPLAGGQYKTEAGNYGKLTRLHNPAGIRRLDQSVRGGATLRAYTNFVAEVLRLGHRCVGRDIAERYGSVTLIDGPTPPFICIARHENRRLLVAGYEKLPRGRDARAELLRQHAATIGLLLNTKFEWSAVGPDGDTVQSGLKPQAAAEWVRRQRDPSGA